MALSSRPLDDVVPQQFQRPYQEPDPTLPSPQHRIPVDDLGRVAGEARCAGDAKPDVEVAPAVVGGIGEGGGKRSADLLTEARRPGWDAGALVS